MRATALQQLEQEVRARSTPARWLAGSAAVPVDFGLDALLRGCGTRRGASPTASVLLQKRCAPEPTHPRAARVLPGET